jgi:hypothetical protein
MRLDLGCGTLKREGFVGVDIRQFPGVDVVGDLGKETWPWPDDSIEEVHCSHMVEHLTWTERIFFFNELYRVLKTGAKALVVIPHWCSPRYYGDPTHKEPMSEYAFAHMNRAWREKEAPHTDFYTCDFDYTIGYSVNALLHTRNIDYQQYALTWLKGAADDMATTLVKRAPVIKNA